MESIHTANYWMQSVHVTGIDTICNLIKTEQIYPLSCHKGTEGGVEVKLYSFTTSALEATTRPLCRPKKKKQKQYLLYRELGGSGGGPDGCGKSRPPQGFEPQIVQSVASRYTDYANLAALLQWYCFLQY